MRVTIFSKKDDKYIEDDLDVMMITLSRRKIDPSRLSVAYCSYCAHPIAQFQGQIVSIIPGGLPENLMERRPNVVNHCSVCKTKWIFNGIV